MHGLWPATSTDEERLEAAMANISPAPGFYMGNWFKQINDVEWDAVNTYAPAAARSVFERLTAAGAAYCPTLVFHAAVDLPEWMRLDDDRPSYMTPDTPQFWTFVRDHIFHGGGRSPDEATKRRALFEHRKAIVAAMDEAGVRILAGTDSVTPGLFPGFSLHDELELLAEAGLSPMRAIQTATIEPARFLGRSHWAGTVEPGRVADLVILDGNPLDDITNTKRIHAVVARGRYIGPDERNQLLATASTVARADG